MLAMRVKSQRVSVYETERTDMSSFDGKPSRTDQIWIIWIVRSLNWVASMLRLHVLLSTDSNIRGTRSLWSLCINSSFIHVRHGRWINVPVLEIFRRIIFLDSKFPCGFLDWHVAAAAVADIPKPGSNNRRWIRFNIAPQFVLTPSSIRRERDSRAVPKRNNLGSGIHQRSTPSKRKPVSCVSVCVSVTDTQWSCADYWHSLIMSTRCETHWLSDVTGDVGPKRDGLVESHARCSGERGN